MEKHLDRFEFSNPGTLLVSFEQLLRGNVSECRNKALQTMFMMIGVAEKAGSGVDKIHQGWVLQHWRPPGIEEHVQPNRVQWNLPMISLIPEDSLCRLHALFGKKFERFNKEEVQALVTADVENSVDNSRMRQITGGHAADMTLMLQNLVANGALIQEGQGRWTRYHLPRLPYSEPKSSDSEPKSSDSEPKSSDSVHKSSDSVHKTTDSVHKTTDSVHNGEFTAQELETLNEIAYPAKSRQRLLPQEMELLVFKLCTGRWLTRKQLGILLNRNPDGLRSRFLTSMVAHNRLHLRYPDKPNRTDQAYIAATGAYGGHGTKYPQQLHRNRSL